MSDSVIAFIWDYIWFLLLLPLLLIPLVQLLMRFLLLALLVPVYLAVLGLALMIDVVGVVIQHLRGREENPNLSGFVSGIAGRFVDVLGSLPEPRREIRAADLVELEQLLALSPTGFEVAVGDLLRARDCTQVRRVGGAGDLSVDLTCRDPAGKSVAIQCKRYLPHVKVGSRDIQQFIGMTTTHHKVDRGIFVTTSSFTQPAIELARQHQIELVDGLTLSEWLLGTVGVGTEEPDALVAELEQRPAGS